MSTETVQPETDVVKLDRSLVLLGVAVSIAVSILPKSPAVIVAATITIFILLLHPCVILALWFYERNRRWKWPKIVLTTSALAVVVAALAVMAWPEPPIIAVYYAGGPLNGRRIKIPDSPADPRNAIVRHRFFLETSRDFLKQTGIPSIFYMSGISLRNTGVETAHVYAIYLNFTNRVSIPPFAGGNCWGEYESSERSYPFEFRCLWGDQPISHDQQINIVSNAVFGATPMPMHATRVKMRVFYNRPEPAVVLFTIQP